MGCGHGGGGGDAYAVSGAGQMQAAKFYKV